MRAKRAKVEAVEVPLVPIEIIKATDLVGAIVGTVPRAMQRL